MLTLKNQTVKTKCSSSFKTHPDDLLVDSKSHSIRLEGDTASLGERWVTPYTKRSGVRGIRKRQKSLP